VDSRGTSDVSLYQAYIEVNDMFGQPLRLRIGRQELKFGSGWLVGTNDAGSFFRGLSFDAIRATYKTDQFSVDAFWAKLVETSPKEEDGDVNFAGVYGSFLGIENVSLDAYWFWLRDARSLTTTNFGWFGECIENILGVDNYGVTNLHTVGLRGAGTFGALDFEAEGAYQFGDSYSNGFQFSGAGLLSPYGDDDNRNPNNFAANAEVGYTFDVMMSPRVFAGGAYFGGEDKRDLGFGQWLGSVFCPFWHERQSISFNRLFSDWKYSHFLDAMNADLSNSWLVRGGVSALPLENLKVLLTGTYFESLSDYRTTWPSCWFLGYRWTPLYPFSFVDQPSKSDLGLELSASATYNYTEDLSFELGYSHFFVGKGLKEGNFNLQNGLAFDGGTSNKDGDYVWVETKLAF
jgi:hypothetical protein